MDDRCRALSDKNYRGYETIPTACAGARFTLRLTEKNLLLREQPKFVSFELAEETGGKETYPI
jgi:hypothetical protein